MIDLHKQKGVTTNAKECTKITTGNTIKRRCDLRGSLCTCILELFMDEKNSFLECIRSLCHLREFLPSIAHNVCVSAVADIGGLSNIALAKC